MKKKDHLPVYGVGPVCVYLMVGLLIGGIVLRQLGLLESGAAPQLRWLFWLLGAVLIGLGVLIWVRAVIVDRVGDSILKNELVTTDVYAWVRNPIYSAIAMALTGIGLLFCNLWLLLLPVLYWLDITVLMKCTEEKWLRALYGQAYEDYCRRVNRCIPWFPKK